MAPAVAAGGARQEQRVLAGVVGVRRRGVAAVVGGEDEQVAGAQQLEPAPDRGVDPCSAAAKALDVLAVAVDLVGLDEVGEHEPASRPSSSRSWSASARSLVGAGMGFVDPRAGEQVGDLADGVDRRRRRPAARRR